METRAHYVLIGTFAVAGFLGLLLFFLWFARIEFDRQFAYYDIDFPTVSGLSNASDVRFSGFPVGQVVDVSLAPDDSGDIRVRIEVDAETPIRTSSVATIESQGVTGVSYVSLSAGDPDDPLLRAVSPDPVPIIPSERSVLQRLSQDAPEIIEEVLGVAKQLREILGPENQARITAILSNLEDSSQNLGNVLDDFSAVTETVATASKQIASFADRLDPITNAATKMLDSADVTLKKVGDLADRAQQTLAAADGALGSGQKALASADAFIAEQAPRLINDLNETTARLRAQVDLVGMSARQMMDELRNTSSVASERLSEIEATIVATETMLEKMTAALAAVDDASRSFEVLMEGDGAALVVDMRAMVANAERVLASANAVAETDLPAIVKDVRAASQTAARVVEEVGADLSSAAGRIDDLSETAVTSLGTVTDTFERANVTLGKLNSAVETGERALASADSAFSSADRLMGEDVKLVVADLREALDRIDTAMAKVSEDLPVISAELRQTAERANAAIGQFRNAVSESTPSIRSFARDGLPQYTRLARETRDLIENLDKLVRRIERDPARYILGRDAPEFRR